MPSAGTGSSGAHPQKRLRKLLRNAEHSLLACKIHPAEARTILDPARKFLGQEGPWEDEAHPLALFLAPEVFLWCRPLLTDFNEHVLVTARFDIKPFLTLIEDKPKNTFAAFSEASINRPVWAESAAQWRA